VDGREGGVRRAGYCKGRAEGRARQKAVRW
jgi:hypothetical protein